MLEGEPRGIAVPADRVLRKGDTWGENSHVPGTAPHAQGERLERVVHPDSRLQPTQDTVVEGETG